MLGSMIMKIAKEKGLFEKFQIQLRKLEEAILPPK